MSKAAIAAVIVVAALALACLVVGAVFMATDAGYSPAGVRVELDCPTEDSCKADYRDGSWYVEQVKP